MKRYFRQIHTVLAFPAGLILVITCLTGAMLVFQEEILVALNPSHYYVKEVKTEAIPLDRLIPMVNNQLKNNRVAAVRISNDPKKTYSMTLAEGFRISAFVDPYTGQVVGEYKFREHPFFYVMSLHRWLMDGSRTWGKYATGIATILFIGILVSGLIVWFPRKLKKRNFRVRLLRGRFHLFYDLHTVLGVYASLILLVCALTGLMWSFEWYRNGVFSLFGARKTQAEAGHGREGPKKEKRKELDLSHWQQMANRLASEHPDYYTIQLQDGMANLQLMPNSRLADQYRFDPSSGEIKEVKAAAEQSRMNRIWGWVYSLHVGNYAGVWSKILTFIAALVGASLPVTGYWLYIKKRIQQRTRARKSGSGSSSSTH